MSDVPTHAAGTPHAAPEQDRPDTATRIRELRAALRKPGMTGEERR